MKKSDVQKLFASLGSNLNLANIFYGDEVLGERISMPYSEAKKIYELLKQMQTSNSIIWEDEETK